MQQRSEETRARILEAANALFSKNGYDATSVAEICQAAEVSKGAFYHHFPSKHDVFLASMENWLNQLTVGFGITAQEIDDIPQAILQMADIAGGAFQAADVRLSIFLEFWVQAYRDPVIWQAAIAPYRRFETYFANLIQRGIQEGSLRPVDPDGSARVLVSLAIGLLMQALFDPQGADWRREARQSVELFLNGLARRSL